MIVRYHLNKIKLSKNEKRQLKELIEKMEQKFSRLGNDELEIDFGIDQDRRQRWEIKVGIKTPCRSFRAQKNGFEYKTVLDRLEETIEVQVQKTKVR